MPDKSDFVLERCKYFLARKHALNEGTFKVVAIYQAVALAIFAGQFGISGQRKGDVIGRDTAIFASYGLLVFFLFASVLTLCLLVGGVAAWLKYRADEAGIEREVIGE